jgi:hypothetical protein
MVRHDDLVSLGPCAPPRRSDTRYPRPVSDVVDEPVSRTYRIGRGLLGLLILGSLLACASGGCNLDFSSFGDGDNRPSLGLVAGEAGQMVVVVPSCVPPIERIAVVDSNMTVVWDVRSLSMVSLESTFEIGDSPDGFLVVEVPLAAPLQPTESYQVVVGEAPANSGQTPTTTTTSTTVPPEAGGTLPETTPSSRPSGPTTESEFFDSALAVGAFRPEDVTGDKILVGRRKVSLAEFEDVACEDPDSTTTTR